MNFEIYSYMVYMAIFVWIPVSITIFRHYGIFKKYSKPIRKMILFTVFAIYLPWDNLAVYFNVWNYPADKVLGIYLFLSPIESLLFTIGVDLAVGFIAIIMYEQYRKDHNISVLKLFYYIIIRK